MTPTQIKQLKAQGLTDDDIYRQAVKTLGYHEIHDATPRRHRRALMILERIYKRIKTIH